MLGVAVTVLRGFNDFGDGDLGGYSDRSGGGGSLSNS